MPGRPPPGQGIGKLGSGQGRVDSGGGGDLLPVPTDALRGWGDLTRSLSRHGPARLTTAAQYRHVALLSLRRVRRVR